MEFLTHVNILPSSRKINYQSKILSFGSCFSESIGKKLQRAYFQIDINPFGILFNPASIAQNIEMLIENHNFTENDLLKNGSLYFNFAFDTSFSDYCVKKCLEKMNSRFTMGFNDLQNADILFITFGTAWVFEHKETGKIVANCHKLPSENFVRRRLDIDEIVFNFQKLFLKLKKFNPDLFIILTVSPIRHVKDGFHENNLSKSILLLSAEKLEKEFENIMYFPAYEIVMDELRDYRFYATDMLHPSESAVEHIWEKFSDTFFSPQTKKILSLAQKVAADNEHLARFEGSEEYANFLKIKEKRENELLLKIKETEKSNEKVFL
ncbi:MAG: GSCFA domain-containing protein [Paludibacter sp.]|nr:GSCFA domain-containing protein [Paludibacter sp.]